LTRKRASPTSIPIVELVVRHALRAVLAVAFAASACADTTSCSGRGNKAAETSRPPRPEIAALYFPGYHRDAHYDQWFGDGWNEWKLLAEATPRFPGQRVVGSKWGAFDEAEPVWMQKQIDLAADHGIDVFIFDWYWYSGVRILERPLREAFLTAPNRNRLKFALMWANTDWRDYFPAPLTDEAKLLVPMRHTTDDFTAVMQHCIDLYFKQPNYWRVNGGLYFSFFEPERFVEQLGGAESARMAMEGARSQTQRAGLGTIHFAAFTWKSAAIPQLKQAGFDSLTTYTINSSGKAHNPDKPLDNYSDLVERHSAFWKEMDTGALPYAPTLTTGWDTTPRWAKGSPFPATRADYPYGTVVVGNGPELFRKLCRDAAQHAGAAKVRPPAIIINAWNEWTEGSALLPESEWGTGNLEAVRDVFGTAPTR
jgi:hypothetical protein